MRRAATLAGLWYPGEARACREAIEVHAGDASTTGPDRRASIGPHAGWAYSGDCAARTYRALGRRDADVVVIFGSHRGPHGPNTLFRGEGWETPLGVLETDRELTARIGDALRLDDEPIRPTRPDNAAELHMPFARYFFPKASLVMLGVAASEIAIEIGATVGALARDLDRDAVFVGSTDLTHYGPSYEFAPAGAGPDAVAWVREQNDAGFLDAVLATDSRRALDHATRAQSACCPGAAVAAIEAARAYEGTLRPALVDHYLSYDVRPGPSFVGYAGVVL